MTNMISRTGKTKSIPGGLAFAGCMSMMITLICSAIIANLINTEILTWEKAGYWIMGMLFAASFISGKCAYWAIKRQQFLISMMSGILYWSLLLCSTALFFGGDYDAVLETAGIICAGSCSSFLLSKPARRKSNKKIGFAYR